MQHLLTISLSLIIAFSCASSIEHPTEKISVDTLIKEANIFEDTSTVNGITFAVDSVAIATELLPVHPIKTVISNQLLLPITYLPAAHESLNIAPIHGNGLIWTVQECYDKHRPLILSPDVIWLTICQGVSLHVNQNFDSLKSVLFNENRPDEIIARNDSLTNDADQWSHLINDIADQATAYTNPTIADFFVPEYSTTTPIDKMVYQINLLETFEKAFTYVGESGCGIPSIKLEGYQKDWIAMYDRLDQLDSFGLTEWKENLKPIIQEFIASYDGKVNLPFWKDIYKNAVEYNGFYISGWIIKFFPYIKIKDSYDYETDFVSDMGYRAGISYKANPYLNGTDYLMSTLSTQHFPAGVSKIDLEWRDYFSNKTTEMLINGGFFGMEQFEDKSLKPFIAWVVTEKNAKPLNYENLAYQRDTMPHTLGHWSPKVIEKLQDSAVYNFKEFDDQASSLIPIKEQLIAAIKKNAETKKVVLAGNVVEFVVMSNGAVTNIEIHGPTADNEALLELVTYELKNLPEPWFPATAFPEDMLRWMTYFGDPPTVKINANSLVVIVF
ncbi:MAG: DUF4419 domain-containing protein [Crocinitomix sp.]|nr:DUF4419 domain-containing protein [Crocinitomix sp.]